MNPFQCLLTGVLTAGLMASLATHVSGHFIWLIRHASEEGVVSIRVAFGEGPTPGGTELFPEGRVPVLHSLLNKQLTEISTREEDGSLLANCPAAAVVHCDYTYGLFARGDAPPKLLRYYALTGPTLTAQSPTWKNERIDLDFVILPSLKDGQLVGQVLWHGKPLAESDVAIQTTDDETSVTTDRSGRFRLDAPAGKVGIRAKHVVDREGAFEGSRYSGELHYVTLVVDCSSHAQATPSDNQNADVPSLPNAVTSFGAAKLGDSCYVYGGHIGRAHEYSKAGHAHQLLRYESNEDSTWTVVLEGPPIQGLALVSDQSSLYRIGGFTASNAPGEPHSLWSQSDVARFAPNMKAWEPMPSLPVPRSSFDAVISDQKIYVAGGWQLSGEAEPRWMAEVLMLDLSDTSLHWKTIAKLPRAVRANSLAIKQDRLYVIGGMQSDGNPTTAVQALDLQSMQWEQVTPLPGPAMHGFGTAAVSHHEEIYVSNLAGKVYRLSDSSQSWQEVAHLTVGRFFHRMLPLSPGRLVVIAGANMDVGRFDDSEIVQLSSAK